MNSYIRNTALALGLAALIPVLIPLPAAAQEDPAPASVDAACMSRANSDGSRMAILLPQSDIETMTAKGFSAEPCDADFPTVAEREVYRDTVCMIASMWRAELQDRFERARGERPAVLCGMAEVVAGQWKWREGN